uniref:Uncharacterized protein n=1 Tax=Tetranychus urticae TaxID=32264 RepID=T1KME2_TETUR
MNFCSRFLDALFSLFAIYIVVPISGFHHKSVIFLSHEILQEEYICCES